MISILNVRYMKISLLFFVALSVVQAYGHDHNDSLYKVLKIKTTGDYYVIHASRNDSLFKIISEKVSRDVNPPEVLLKKGRYYAFVFRNKDHATTNPDAEPLLGNISYLHVKTSKFWGDTKIKFSKRFHNRMYTTKNLNGLYYIPPKMD